MNAVFLVVPGWLRWLGCALGACVLATLAPAPAQACGACVCDASRLFGPVVNRVGAPLNIRIFVPPSQLDGLQLTTGGVDVPIAVEPAGDVVGSAWVTPRDPLAPFTEYVLASVDRQISFVTGASRDVTPPTFDDVAMRADLGSRGALCGVSVGGGLAMSGYSDDTAVGGFVPVQIDLELPAGVRRIFLPLAGTANPQEEPFGRLEEERGAGECFGPAWFPEAVSGQAYRATVTIHDWAGNSTVVDGLEFTASRVLPGGCGSPPPTDPPPTDPPPLEPPPLEPPPAHAAAACTVAAVTGSNAPSGVTLTALALSCLVVVRRCLRRRGLRTDHIVHGRVADARMCVQSSR